MAVFGHKRLMRRFEQLPKEIQEDVRDIIEEVTLDIQKEAIQNAPAAGDRIPLNSSSLERGSGNSQRINTGINQFIGASFDVQQRGLSGEVFIESGAGPLAIYIEFGTGVSAANYVPTLDPEFQAVAQKYYINGKGTIIKQPFLLPAWFKHQPTVVPKIKKALQNIKL
jgi:hypothetical protein